MLYLRGFSPGSDVLTQLATFRFIEINSMTLFVKENDTTFAKE